MESSFVRLSRGAAFATALTGALYSIAFVVVVQRGSRWAEWAAAAMLTIGGLVALPVLVTVTSIFGERPDAAAPARLALVVGGVAAVMTSLHGAYDLAALAKPVAATAGDVSPVDPRGFATFALAGVAVIVIAALARADAQFPRWLSPVAAALGAALIATWIGRLAVLDPTSAWLRITTTAAAVLNPIAYLGFASACRARRAPSTRSAAAVL